MIKKVINDKDIYIVESHNQVLKAWEGSKNAHVFSLDYHTDTKEAFHTYAYWKADSEIKSGKVAHGEARKKQLIQEKIGKYTNKEISIDKINLNLRHDEHIDFAIQTEMVKSLFILSTSSNISSSNPNVYIDGSEIEYNHQPIIEFSPRCTAQCEKSSHDKHCTIERADSVIEDSFLIPAIERAKFYRKDFFVNYILDIDCDYFNTNKSMQPQYCETFKSLIRKAQFITIAKEPECVKICRVEGCGITADIILERLLSIIQEA